MTVHIELRNVFGLTKAYPACPRAMAFADIAGTKTLTPATLRGVLKLGEDIVVTGRGEFTIPADYAPHHAHAAVNNLQLSN